MAAPRPTDDADYLRIYGDRRINSSIYCANCGYNLKTLPYIYHCPECGNSYNARSAPHRGVFHAYDSGPPLLDLGVTVLLVLATSYFGWVGFRFLPQAVALFVFLSGLTIIAALRTARRIREYWQTRHVLRRIRESQSRDA